MLAKLILKGDHGISSDRLAQPLRRRPRSHIAAELGEREMTLDVHRRRGDLVDRNHDAPISFVDELPVGGPVGATIL